MTAPIEVMCPRCEGTGEEAFRISCIAGSLDYEVRCPSCHGTGWVCVDHTHSCAQAWADLVRADQLRRHQAGLAADLAYQIGAGEAGQ